MKWPYFESNWILEIGLNIPVSLLTNYGTFGEKIVFYLNVGKSTVNLHLLDLSLLC